MTSFKPASHLEATGYNQVMQEINSKDSKSVHLGIADDYERGLKQRAANGQPEGLITGVRKACEAIRSMYGQKSVQL